MYALLENLIANDDVLCLYSYGSRVYGCNSENSDYDFVMVVNDGAYTADHIASGNVEINIYAKSEWAQMARDCSVTFCECYFLPTEFKHKETFIPNFAVDVSKVRASFSKLSSNSFVKCKKKLTVEKDFAPYIGKKSLWHSFRILMFGCQILSEGKISDYSCANFLYDEIVKAETNDWSYFKVKYQQLYNSYRSEFRRLEVISN